MTHRIKILLVIIVSCCVLFSVGFANWAIFDYEPSSDTDLELGSEEIFFSNDYIKLSDKEDNPKWFSYTYRGFRNGDTIEDIGYTSNITVEYVINLEKCKNIYVGSDKVTVEVTIGLKNNTQYNVFEKEGFVTARVNATDGLIDWDQDGTTFTGGKMYCLFSVNLNASEASTANIEIIYNFDLKDFGTYSNYIYNTLNGTNQQFEFNAMITERE